MKTKEASWTKTLLSVSLYVMKRTRFLERYPLFVASLHLKWVNYHGGNQSLEQTKLFIARIITYMWLALLLFTLSGLLIDSLFYSCGFCITLIIPVGII